jgi:hypothetical protein
MKRKNSAECIALTASLKLTSMSQPWQIYLRTWIGLRRQH